MDCVNFLCIYQKDNKCMLDKIEINESGNCGECIYPNISEDYLEYEKEKLRKRFEKEDKEYE